MTSNSEKIEKAQKEILSLRSQIAQYDQARNELNVRLIKWEGVVEFLKNEEKQQELSQSSTEGEEGQAPQ